MTASDAVSLLNDNRLRLPQESLNELVRIIVSAAARNDPAACNFLWLLTWNPQQMAN